MNMSAEQAKLCVGLTGGIGCGKSTVAQLFEALGARIIDADVISHQLTQTGGGAIPDILTNFGHNFITPEGAMNRGKMRELIFTDKHAKLKLEAILHPLILTACKEQLTEAGSAPYTILVVPLLLACPDFLALVQRILVIDCSEENQILRVRQRSALDEFQIRAIIAKQVSRKERLAHADDIVENDGGIDGLTEQVSTLHQYYKNNNHLTAS